MDSTNVNTPIIRPSGWLILDKPEGITSTRAGSLIKRALKVKRLGHAGTLDPFATGILPLALGEATKIMPYVVDDIKEYEFELVFGEERDSHDRDGQVVATTALIPTESAIRTIVKQFQGTMMQTPPLYSALKIGGKRACDLMRQGKEVTIPPRQVDIHTLELMGMKDDRTAHLRVKCGKGTYVRALGRDIAHALGSLAYVNQLRRTRVGKFSLKNSVTLDTVLGRASCFQDHQNSLLLSIRDVLDDIPAFPVHDSDAIRIRQGQSIPYEGGQEETTVLLLHNERELALAQPLGGYLYPKKVFSNITYT
jgi:tRNA pseudouridine55 synthase